jgi:hypothetical protein
MNATFLDDRKKIVTNATLLALYLIIAAHFAAPSLLDFFGFSLRSFTLHPLTLLKFVTAALTELNPWQLILSLFPHFLFGFEIETVIGSGTFAVALFASGTITNVVTILVSLFLNRFVTEVLPVEYVFASSAPVLLLCLSAFIVFVRVDVRFGRICRCTVWGVLGMIGVRCVVGPLVHVVNLLISICVDYFVVRWLDESLTVVEYIRVVFLGSRNGLDGLWGQGDERQKAARVQGDEAGELERLVGDQV